MTKDTIAIPIEINLHAGFLRVPQNPIGLVIFAHGSGSGYLSPRNNFVADVLNKANIASLLFDLLTEEEDLVYKNRFNIELLTTRLIKSTKWAEKQPKIKNLKIGFFGASTGSASALTAAARIGSKIKAVVSRGGRPDLALDEIPLVKSPTLLIVGGEDFEVIELNKLAFGKLESIKKLEIVPGATHLFEEPGTLEKVAELATDWFKKYLASQGDVLRS